jgi:adenylosuccinate lyase
MKTWQGDASLAANVKDEAEIMEHLSPDEIDDLCSLDIHFRHIDDTFRKVGL